MKTLNKKDSLVGRIGSSCGVSARSMLTAFICGATTAACGRVVGAPMGLEKDICSSMLAVNHPIMPMATPLFVWIYDQAAFPESSDTFNFTIKDAAIYSAWIAGVAASHADRMYYTLANYLMG